MIHNESTALSVAAGGPSAVATPIDTSIDVRWATWQKRGLAHERAVRQKLTIVAGFGGLAAAVAIAYTLLNP